MSDIDRLRLDAGISLRALAREAGVDEGYLSRLIAGTRVPTIGLLVALSAALGGDLSIKVFPNGRPSIHDGIQARIIEELLRIAAPRWRRSVEVPVVRPVRGFIDFVLDEPVQAVAVAAEVQSRIDRLDQQLRWAQEKAQSLPSSDLWRFVEGDPEVSRLLVLRSTVATREIAKRFGTTLASAYPARAKDVYDAITSDARWPGAGILWARVGGDSVRILEHPPRGVALGR